jgi:hypothetical protein
VKKLKLKLFYNRCIYESRIYFLTTVREKSIKIVWSLIE